MFQREAGPVGATTGRDRARDQPPYARVLAPFVIAIAVFMVLCGAGLYGLSSVRALIGGESLWSKARSTAVDQLHRYALTHDPRSLDRFDAAIAVPLADRDARNALAPGGAGAATARAAFLRGGIHDNDVDGMVWLLRCCASLAPMHKALQIWRDTDEPLARLQLLASQLQQGPATPATLELIDRINDGLVREEMRYLETLGDASRGLLHRLLAAIVVLGVLLAALGTSLAHGALRRHEQQRRLLRAANRRWELASEAAGAGVFTWTGERGEVQLDRRARELLALDPDPADRPLPTRIVRERIAPEDQDAVRQAFRQALADGQPFRVRYQAQLPGGRRRHLESTGLLQPDTTPPTMFGLLRDVGDEVLRQRAELEHAAAERAQRAQVEFLSRLSHELRTPLNAILGFAQLVLGDPTDRPSATTAERVGFIQDAGRHLLALVDDVLNLSEIDSGRVAVTISAVPLHEVMQSALRLTMTQQRDFDIVVDNRVAPGLWVRGDQRRLEQVFVNLVSNGCKYNRRGGMLRLAATPWGDQVRIEVADQGPGLSEAQRLQLFQPFRRLHADSGVEGSGLGLVIVKLLLDAMGGGIEVEGEPGEGSVFVVSLPAAAPDAVAPGQRQALRQQQ